MAGDGRGRFPYPSTPAFGDEGGARGGLVARYSLLGKKGSGRLSSNVIVVLLDLDKLLAQLGVELALSLELLHLHQPFGEFFPLLHQGSAQLAGFLQAAIRLGEMGFQGTPGLLGGRAGAKGEELV